MTPSTLPQSKITPAHLRRQALIYIRQSSTQQVRSHQESKERQYALVQRAAALGWTPETIATIDEDQGRSGTSAVHRPGFKKLVAEISAGQIGIVMALEASRLARSSADWHRLVEICSVTRTVPVHEGLKQR
jgi:DNA invertase Pin-like site-specific DNA recombinase